MALKHEAEETTVRVVTLEEKLGKKDDEVVALNQKLEEESARSVTLEEKLGKKTAYFVSEQKNFLLDLKKAELEVTDLENKLSTAQTEHEVDKIRLEKAEKVINQQKQQLIDLMKEMRRQQNRDEPLECHVENDANALMQATGGLQQKLDAIQSQTYHKDELEIGMKCL